jgi:hypothetical protein
MNQNHVIVRPSIERWNSSSLIKISAKPTHQVGG